MRYLLLACVLVVGCSGGSSPSTPASPSATAATPTPAAAQFPSMNGGWSGTRSVTVTVRGSGQRTSNTCTDTWIISAQTAGRFSGTFQSSGGTTSACSDSGSLVGDVSTSGSISGLTLTGQSSSGATTCTRIGGTGVFAGVVSNGAAVTAQASDAVRCTTTVLGSSGTTEADRTMALTMNKR